VRVVVSLAGMTATGAAKLGMADAATDAATDATAGAATSVGGDASVPVDVAGALLPEEELLLAAASARDRPGAAPVGGGDRSTAASEVDGWPSAARLRAGSAGGGSAAQGAAEVGVGMTKWPAGLASLGGGMPYGD
jgi:hypothetical protein